LHVNHEMKGEKDGFPNSPNAIGWEKLLAGVQEGIYPNISALTAPAFGLKETINGATLSDDPVIVGKARKGHLLAMRRSRVLKRLGIGKGYSIVWPASDSTSHAGPLSLLDRVIARQRMIAFWVKTLKMALDDPLIAEGLGPNEPLMWFEFKPNIPGVLDFFPTMQAAIAFCEEVNRQVGRVVIVINVEWAHLLIGGMDVITGTKMQIDAGLFYELVHVNWAQLAIIEWNKTYTEIKAGSPSEDFDWQVGAGTEEDWAMQREAVRLMLETGQNVTFEHDIYPAGQDPVEFYDLSRGNLEKMISEIGVD